MMPKAKPNQIIVHRLEAGTWERDNLLKPAADIAKTVAFFKTGAIVVVCAGVGVAGYGAYWFLRGLGNTAQDISDWWDGVANFSERPVVSSDTFKSDPDKPGYAKDGTPRNLFGLPGWGIWPGVI
jgi:hypothetical protein